MLRTRQLNQCDQSSARRVSFTILVSGFLMLPAIANAFENCNAIYSPTIQTVILNKEGFEMAAPILQLESDNRLRLSFDDLDPVFTQFSYTIRHCDARWNTSTDLLVSDYLEGIQEERIGSFAYSYNTTVEYIHYSTFFPTPYLKPKISGNYLLIVYDQDPEHPVITWRFMVVEPSQVSIQGKVVRSAQPDDSFTKQQIDFTINMGDIYWSDFKRQITVVVTQNERWDNARYDLEPRFIRGSVLDYTFDARNSFNGGNEFRAFDIKSLNYQSENVRRIYYDTAYQVDLLDDIDRSSRQYASIQDINGRRLIKSEDHAGNSDIEADYAWVHFSLSTPHFIAEGPVYLMGALSNWQMNDHNQMKYNFLTKKYTRSILVKQGYYNYMYVVKEKGSTAGNETWLEGNHWETGNMYMIFVYYRELTGLYDHLTAVKEIIGFQQ